MKLILNLLKLAGLSVLACVCACLIVLFQISREQNTPTSDDNGRAFQTVFDEEGVPQSLEEQSFTVTVLCTADVECKRGIKALHNAEAYIGSRVPVKFEKEDVITVHEVVQGTLLERWQQWGEIALKLGTAKSDLTVIFVEDFPSVVNTYNFEEEGIIGLASGIGVLGIKPSAIFVKVMGGEKFLSRIVTHEIGHTLGAEHTDAGIMNGSASVNQFCDEYSLYSLEQIKEHLQKVRIFRALLAGTAGDEKKDQVGPIDQERRKNFDDPILA